MIREPLPPEGAPVIGSNLVERVYDVVEGVGLDYGRATGRPIKQFAEVVERFGAGFGSRFPGAGLLPYDDIDPEPVEHVFVIIIYRATPIFPGFGSKLHAGNAIGGILQIAPDAARTMIEVRRHLRQCIASQRGRTLSAAG